MRKVALITGITGQDGSFLAEFLLEKGYDVHGTIRRSSVDFRERIAHLEGHPAFHLHYADLGDSTSLSQVVKRDVYKRQVYHLPCPSGLITRWSYCQQIVRLVKKEGIDVIHTHASNMKWDMA